MNSGSSERANDLTRDSTNAISDFTFPLSPGMVDASTGARSAALAKAQALVNVARRAQPAWAARGATARAAVIERFRQIVFERRHEIARAITAETGKPLAESLVADVSMTLEGARFLSRIAHDTLRPTQVFSQTLATLRKRIITHREPFGVIAVVSPWNYPFFFPAMHAMTALIAGNAVVLKPSEHSPECGALLERLLREAGVPADVFAVLQGDGKVGAALVSASVDKVMFTGSERTGRAIAVECAPRFVPVSLELGGSDAAVVLDDANMAHAASGILWGRFANAGQTCVAVKRVIAVGAAYDRLVPLLMERVTALRVDADTANDATIDVGPMISATQRDLVLAQLQDALANGAVELARSAPQTDTDRMAPAVLLGGVTPSMRVWQEETFGPLLVVARAASIDDAIALANGTRYGLSASVWTTNAAQGRAIAARFDAGAVCVNDSVLNAGLPEVAHGGVKASGLGRIHGVDGLLECVRTRTVIEDVMPSLRQPWWFGYGPEGVSRLDAYLRLAHGRSWMERLSGLSGTLKMLFRPERPL